MNESSGVAIDALCHALAVPRATYYRHQSKPHPSNHSQQAPKNALSAQEKQQVLNLLHNERFVDKTPYVAFNELMDEGRYYCSPRTMYRVLAEQGETTKRRIERNRRDAIKPELIATSPNEVWSWDITKLRSQQKWIYFYLYVILDIYSRYVVGWLIAEKEAEFLARQLIQKTALRQGIQPFQLTLHADNGPSMKSHSVAKLLENLGIAKTHNRPYNSDDNPFSESHFKTLKYYPEFPGKFNDIKEAEKFLQRFMRWYNLNHYHSNLCWLTPATVHYGSAMTVLEKRHAVKLQAYLKYPLRFNNKPPKLQQLAPAVYINPPQTVKINSLDNKNNDGQLIKVLAG